MTEAALDEKPQAPPERIVAAACIGPDGEVYHLPPPARHHDVMRMMGRKAEGWSVVPPDDQGFLTTGKRFVGRIAARMIARRAGQISGETFNPHMLFSEDLW